MATDRHEVDLGVIHIQGQLAHRLRAIGVEEDLRSNSAVEQGEKMRVTGCIGGSLYYQRCVLV